jgi:1-aminocyclopropane-1-carboxylate deaminase/D-cysteine desulfhydrase-like pyridoxal-dependent ACC family enzyme
MELRTVSAWSARLDALPRLSLMTDPTPLAFAPHLSATLGGPKLWFKRDDLLPVAFSGNKVRSLDLIVADALRQGADTLVTGAGPLSNHVRASAGVAALASETLDQCRCLGIEPRVVLMAVGGAGTLAGWLLGTALFGAGWRLEAVTVSRPAPEALTRAQKLAAEAAAMINCAPRQQRRNHCSRWIPRGRIRHSDTRRSGRH